LVWQQNSATDTTDYSASKSVNADTTTAPASWKTYTSDDGKLTFKYPENVLVGVGHVGEKESTKPTLTVTTIDDINTAVEGSLGYDKDTLNKDKSAIAKGDPTVLTGLPVTNSAKIINIPNAIGKTWVSLTVLDSCDVTLARTANVYSGNTLYIIYWYYNNDSALKSDNPSYFESSSSCGTLKAWKTNGATDFYSDLVAGKTDAGTQTWFKNFDTLLGTAAVK
jgi:hypothetical protein